MTKPVLDKPENILRKEENAGNQHFPDTFKGIWLLHIYVNPFPNKPWFLHVCRIRPENTMGKGEIAPFPIVFSTLLDNLPPFSSNLKLSSANSFSLKV